MLPRIQRPSSRPSPDAWGMDGCWAGVSAGVGEGQWKQPTCPRTVCSSSAPSPT